MTASLSQRYAAIEDSGFCEKRKGGNLHGRHDRIGDSYPLTRQAVLGMRYPVGALASSRLSRWYCSFRGEAGKRQIDGAQIGLTHNVGGSGGTAVVHISGGNHDSSKILEKAQEPV